MNIVDAAKRITLLRNGAILIAVALIMVFGMMAFAGASTYGSGEQLSASSDWMTFLITGAVFLLPVLALAVFGLVFLEGSRRALVEAHSVTHWPGRSVPLAARARSTLAAMAVVGFIWGGVGAFLEVGCPQVQHDATDAMCVGANSAFVADVFIGFLGAIIWLVVARGLERDLIGAVVQGKSLPAMDRLLTASLISYADRRWALSDTQRQRLAERIGGPLRHAVPQLVQEKGPLGALDDLADRLR